MSFDIPLSREDHHCCEKQIEPKHNFCVVRLYLQSYRQQDCESVDDFITKLKLQAHVMIITAASMQVMNDVICEAAKTVHSVHQELDPSIDTSDVIYLTQDDPRPQIALWHWVCRGGGNGTGHRLRHRLIVLPHVYMCRIPLW